METCTVNDRKSDGRTKMLLTTASAIHQRGLGLSRKFNIAIFTIINTRRPEEVERILIEHFLIFDGVNFKVEGDFWENSQRI